MNGFECNVDSLPKNVKSLKEQPRVNEDVVESVVSSEKEINMSTPEYLTYTDYISSPNSIRFLILFIVYYLINSDTFKSILENNASFMISDSRFNLLGILFTFIVLVSTFVITSFYY